MPYYVVSSNANLLVPNATLFHFGILTSNVHNAWMRAVWGRLEMRYRYSVNIVYNNFPWPGADASSIKQTSLGADASSVGQKPNSDAWKRHLLRIEQTAQAILDTRANHPDSSLSDLYSETFMPKDLRQAHQANDRAVMEAYGFDPKMTESQIVAELFRLYEKLTEKR